MLDFVLCVDCNVKTRLLTVSLYCSRYHLLAITRFGFSSSINMVWFQPPLIIFVIKYDNYDMFTFSYMVFGLYKRLHLFVEALVFMNNNNV